MEHLKLNKPDKKTIDCYDESDKTEETLVRVMELIFSSEIFGDDYLKWAIEEQNKAGFKNVEKIIKTYINNKKKIKSINNLIYFLLENNLLVKELI